MFQVSHPDWIAEQVLAVIHELMPLSRAVVRPGSAEASAWADRIRTLLQARGLVVVSTGDLAQMAAHVANQHKGTEHALSEALRSMGAPIP